MNTLPVERHDEVLGAELCVLVFRHEGSPACAAFQPELDEFVRRRPLIAVWTVEAMQHQDVSERHNLRALPSVVVYREGMPCRRLAGAVSADDLAAIVDEVAAADMDQEYNDWMLGMLESGEAGSPHVGTPHPDASSSAAVDTAASELLVPMTSGTPAGSVFDDGPGPVESQSRDWGELYEEANDAWYAGDAPKALAGFTALLAMKPASTEILNYRGQVLADIGDGALAVRDLSRYLDVALDMWGSLMPAPPVRWPWLRPGGTKPRTWTWPLLSPSLPTVHGHICGWPASICCAKSKPPRTQHWRRLCNWASRR